MCIRDRILRELKRHAVDLEAKYDQVKEDPKDLLNYDLQFPDVLDSFVLEAQGGRRINILGFRAVERMASLVPVIGITRREYLRVDLRSSVWMMGKLLKLLTFTHSLGCTAGKLNGNNLLIEPDLHHIVVFDWSHAAFDEEGVSRDSSRAEIQQAARSVITALGADLHTGTFIDDGAATNGGDVFDPYTTHLWHLATGGQWSASRAHAEFYAVVDQLWKREFYPFTTLPL